jgi:hypothetical protein
MVAIYCREPNLCKYLICILLSIPVHIVMSSQGSIHNGSLLHSEFNIQLLITVHNSSRILTQL